MKKFLSRALVLILSFVMFFGVMPRTYINISDDTVHAESVHGYTGAVINDFNGVADYLRSHKRLPGNYITKTTAASLGWTPGSYLSSYAPGYSIGGDIFGNYEGKLPQAVGRIWLECDIDYSSDSRNAYRILYSNDGYIYKTADHYKTFQLMYSPQKL